MATSPVPGLHASGHARLVGLYGEGYTMADVCKGCQQRHSCASCLDGTDGEYLPPSALAKAAAATSGAGCQPFVAPDGRVFGFVCRRGR